MAVKLVSEFEQAVTERLDSVGKLGINWDQCGALPIDPRILSAARSLLLSLPDVARHLPHIAPLGNGTLQIEWDAADRSLEIEIESPVLLRYLRWQPTHGIEESDTIAASDMATVVGLIQWCMEGDGE